MEQQSKRKSKYALLLVTEKDDGTMKQYTISPTLVEVMAAILFLLIVAVTCKFVYDSITLKDARKEIVDQIVTINNLTDENEALTVENSTLTSKITVLSETVSKKAATEDALSLETVENALPKGFPLSGSATMKEAEEGDPMLIFSASQGVNVITTGTGVVVSVDADETYGTKIIIDHGNGYQSVYRNNGTALVKNGEELGKGYILFTVGEENQELGYQIMKDEEYIDPMLMIDING
ncbi:MAG: M23 family metallopeptidase [Lachnospiraceae bacterium]|nr:M23 family metallopeptidase [Lachnospiraceae bacterium]MDY5870724.1 M23 family metallopeptidase [Lachnospiraceae bacterium]